MASIEAVARPPRGGGLEARIVALTTRKLAQALGARERFAANG